jgi:hypothetical protein
MREYRSTVPVAQALQRHSGGWKPPIVKESAVPRPAADEPEASHPPEPDADAR